MFKQDTYQTIKLFPQEIWELTAVKNYMRIDGNYDDELIKSLVEAAITAAENFTKLCLISKYIKFTSGLESKKYFHLKYSPIKEVVKVSIGSLLTDEYIIDKNNSTLSVKKDLGENMVAIEYIVGLEASDVPASIKHGILLHVTEMYDRQEQGAIGLSQEIKNLYLPYRKIRL